MNSVALIESIVADWEANLPITKETALERAAVVLKPYGKEFKQFSDWFEVNGDHVIDRINHV